MKVVTLTAFPIANCSGTETFCSTVDSQPLSVGLKITLSTYKQIYAYIRYLWEILIHVFGDSVSGCVLKGKWGFVLQQSKMYQRYSFQGIVRPFLKYFWLKP